MQFTLKTLFTTVACALLLSAPAFAGTYTVKKGDSLYRIARANGVSVRSLVAANSIRNRNLIFPGQVLQIPSRGARPLRNQIRPRSVATLSQPTRPTPRPRRMVAQPKASPVPTRKPKGPTTTIVVIRTPNEQFASRTKVNQIGGKNLGASLIRRSTSRFKADDSASFETETTARISVLGRKLNVFRLQRGVEGRSIRTAPRIDRNFEVEILGQNRVSIGQSFTRSFYVTAFQIPVPVGPLVLDLKTSVGTTMDVGATFPFSWNSRTGYGLVLYGSAGLGAKVSLERSIIIANAGIEGRIDLINARVPAKTQLKLTGVDFDVSLVLSSHASISLFAEIGVSFFKRKFRVGVPFMSWYFGRKEIPIMHGSIGLGPRR
ncbi:MAG: LysM peptidoglycan-binding domain-containing protein [Planctomycetes bacterium]|nr:LysM peptidoglycan-binding domain-containing protein [Planctomycetota bacterium]